MEQYSNYLMLVKSNNSNNILMNPFSSHSWEEQAFAEDARGPFGGFVWPPRSYSCSFCKREFRSAQALGGHMNVHRKERAKLKHIVNGTNGGPNSCTTKMAPQNPDYKQNSCKESLVDPGFFPSALSPSRVSPIAIALGEESFDTNSDTKSFVYDEEFAIVGHGINVETNLVLGFELDSCLNTGSSCKRQKTGVTPTMIMDGLDLELRLAS